MFDFYSSKSVYTFPVYHGASVQGPRYSDGMDVNFCGTDRRWWVHAFSLSAGFFILSSGMAECIKLFLDFRHFFTGRSGANIE